MNRLVCVLVAVALFAFSPRADAAIYDFGALSADGSWDLFSGSSEPLDYFTFHISSDVTKGSGSWLHIDTDFSTYDTEIGIYNGRYGVDSPTTQFRISNDDDDWYGWDSELSHGDDIHNYGNGWKSAGRDGDLGAGWYTIVLGGYNTRFRNNIEDILPGDSQGNFNLWVNHFGRSSVIPEPGSLMIWTALGGLMIARRRKQD